MNFSFATVGTACIPCLPNSDDLSAQFVDYHYKLLSTFSKDMMAPGQCNIQPDMPSL